MKLNKKGMTLIELLISISLIGVVLIFLFQMLTDLQNESENNNFASNNQINRTEIIYEVQNDLQKYTLEGVTRSNNIIKLHFAESNKTATLKTEKTDNKYYINYTNADGSLTKWRMKEAMFIESDITIDFDKESNKYYVKINIPIYNDPINEKNYTINDTTVCTNDIFCVNNAVDDIEITYVGAILDIDSSITNNLLRK